MPYVDRDGQGAVSALYTRPQRPEHEFLGSGHAEVVAFEAGPPRTALTRLEFLARFTDAEQAAIGLSQDPEVAVLRLRAQMASIIDLNDCDPLLDLLVAKGLIAVGRKTEILVPAS